MLPGRRRGPGEGTLACDVTDEASVAASIEAVLSLGPLTDVVHAAGVVSVGPVADLTAAELRGVLEVNLVGSFLVARAAARAMTGGGSITLVSSQAGLRGGANWSAYSASKAGSTGWPRAWPRSLPRAASGSTPSARATSTRR